MKNIFKYLIIIILLFNFTGCEKFLDEPESQTILSPEKVWNDQKMIIGLLANLYDRLPQHAQFRPWGGNTYMMTYDEGITPGTTEVGQETNNIVNYPYDWLRLWDYGFIRDANLALEGLDEYSVVFDPATKEQFKSELRFLRAYDYFEMVKRMGGIPLITTQLIFDVGGDPSSLAKARNTEEEVYDFIASELDAIKDNIGNTGSTDRANKYTVLALKCRAMLYAGSIAKYNNLLPVPISLPGNEVGIPAARANDYYQAALDAAKEIINSGMYQLYNANPDPGENFYETLVKKSNPEIILAEYYDIKTNHRHNFSYYNICRTMREDNLESSAIAPPLNLVEAFEYLDGTPGTLKGVGDGTVAGAANWIFYDNLSDIFANKDGRLYGTIVYPGTSFKGVDVQMQAGVMEWNPTTNQYDKHESSSFGALYTDGKLLTGNGGPMRSVIEVSNTGFYIKKFIDPATGSSGRGIHSDIPWPKFRYGEVLLNASEAAFELGGANIADALTYVNQVRERAGFGPNSLNTGTLTFERLQNERRVELCYEDHRIWDLTRWRLAHIKWDGQESNPDAVMYALYPYRVINSVDPSKDGKYVFDKIRAPKFVAPRFYRMGNYYSSISQSVLDNNDKIVKNPFH